MSVTYIENRNTIMSNPNGVMKAIHYFDLCNIMDKNNRIYFYRGDYKNIVEVYFSDDFVDVYYFDHTPKDYRNVIKDNLDLYVPYFTSGGLSGKRFLFDVVMKLPISYTDFVENDYPDLKERHTLILFDKKEGVYITDRDSVKVFTSIQDTFSLDNSLLALANKLIHMIVPRGRETEDGTISMTIIAGLLSNVDIEELEFDVSGNAHSRIYPNISAIPISSIYFDEETTGIKKLNKLKEILPIIKHAPEIKIVKDNNNPNLSEIVKVGLDQFIKTIKNHDRSTIVNIDMFHDKVKAMYIFKGAAFITPGTERSQDYFMEMLSSENIALVSN